MYWSRVGVTRFQSQVSVLQRLLSIPILDFFTNSAGVFSCSLFINILLLLLEIKGILFFIFMF